MSHAIISFEFRLAGDEFRERRHDGAQEETRNEVVGIHGERAFETDNESEFACEQDDVQHWFEDVGVETRQRGGELFNFIGHTLIRVIDLVCATEMGGFVVIDAADIELVDVQSETLSEAQCELVDLVTQSTIYCGSRNGKDKDLKDAPFDHVPISRDQALCVDTEHL